jgi:hypothetical protein
MINCMYLMPYTVRKDFKISLFITMGAGRMLDTTKKCFADSYLYNHNFFNFVFPYVAEKLQRCQSAFNNSVAS